MIELIKKKFFNKYFFVIGPKDRDFKYNYN